MAVYCLFSQPPLAVIAYLVATHIVKLSFRIQRIWRRDFLYSYLTNHPIVGRHRRELVPRVGRQLVDGLVGIDALMAVGDDQGLCAAGFEESHDLGLVQLGVGSLGDHQIRVGLGDDGRIVGHTREEIPRKYHPLALGLQKEGVGILEVIHGNGGDLQIPVVKDHGRHAAGAVAVGVGETAVDLVVQPPAEGGVAENEGEHAVVVLGVGDVDGEGHLPKGRELVDLLGQGAKTHHVVVVGVGDEHPRHVLKGYVVIHQQRQNRGPRVHQVVLASRADQRRGAEAVLLRNAVARAKKRDLHTCILSGGIAGVLPLHPTKNLFGKGKASFIPYSRIA